MSLKNKNYSIVIVNKATSYEDNKKISSSQHQKNVRNIVELLEN